MTVNNESSFDSIFHVCFVVCHELNGTRRLFTYSRDNDVAFVFNPAKAFAGLLELVRVKNYFINFNNIMVTPL